MKNTGKAFGSLLMIGGVMGLASCGGGKTTLTYIGHASVKIVASDSSVLYIDPAYSEWDYENDPADYILVTHGHDDHKPDPSLKLKEGGRKIDHTQALHGGVYETFELGPFKVQAVAAGGNRNHDVRYCVGYLVTVDGITIYHAGDTSKIEQMKDLANLHIDYAMYPIDGIYNMDAAEAEEVANLVGACINIPIHENDQNGSRKSDGFNPKGRLVLKYGETIKIEPQKDGH
ncbi:MAG: MBL fold metallo-hydrolase [Treponema sp.]|nr:MBL fold metallo-hydrolase [Treponema sp.]